MARPLIHDVSDTAFMIAAQRAIESQRPDAMFRDALAERLAGERGQAIVASLPRWSRGLSRWTVAIRTAVIDDLIDAAVARGIDTVLDLGAGLDTRPYRMRLPGSLRWIEVDLPAVVEQKAQLLSAETPRCALERVKLDLGDVAARRRWLADVAATSRSALVVTEGVVPYLTIEQVAALADDLRGVPAVQGWIAEYLAPRIVRARQRSGRGVLQRVPWRFAPNDWFGFFARRGWVAADTRFLVEEGQRRGRPPPLPSVLRAVIAIGGRLISRSDAAASSAARPTSCSSPGGPATRADRRPTCSAALDSAAFPRPPAARPPRRRGPGRSSRSSAPGLRPSPRLQPTAGMARDVPRR